MRRIILLLVLLIFISGCAEKQSVEMKPVKIDGTNFVIDNKTFKFIGANMASLIWYNESGLSVDKAIRTAKESDISVLRIYLPGRKLEGSTGMVRGPTEKDFEKKPIGFYNEYYFKKLDAILDTASKHGVYIIVTLRDFQWEDDPYWYTDAGKNGMFTDPELTEAFKNFITHTLTRKNTINGKIYKDDPVIFAWDIINEPPHWESESLRYAVREWLTIITAHIHSLDTNHPVTVGLTTNDPMWDKDKSWYELINATGIDFFSFHIYPESWSDDGVYIYHIYPYANRNPNPEVTKNLISFRTESFLSFGKPVVMEEFGFSPRFGQTELFKVYRNSMDAAFDSGAAGVVFWHWGIPEVRELDWWILEDLTIDDEEFVAMLKEYADKIKK